MDSRMSGSDCKDTGQMEHTEQECSCDLGAVLLLEDTPYCSLKPKLPQDVHHLQFVQSVPGGRLMHCSEALVYCQEWPKCQKKTTLSVIAEKPHEANDEVVMRLCWGLDLLHCSQHGGHADNILSAMESMKSADNKGIPCLCSRLSSLSVFKPSFFLHFSWLYIWLQVRFNHTCIYSSKVGDVEFSSYNLLLEMCFLTIIMQEP